MFKWKLDNGNHQRKQEKNCREMRLIICFRAQNRSQSLWGWKAALKTAQAGAATAALKPHPVRFWASPRMQIPAHLQVACAVHTMVNSSVHVSKKMLNTASPSTDTWGTKIITTFHFGIKTLTTTLTGCDHPANSLSTEWSTYQIHVYSFETRISCERVPNTPGRSCHSFFPLTTSSVRVCC